MYTDQDLFVDGQVPPYNCATMDSDDDGVPDDLDMCPNTLPIDIENGLVDENGCSLATSSPSATSTPSSSSSPTSSSEPTVSVFLP
jgi:hypothetical protein